MTKYRRLEKGEIIQEGDEWDACRDPWRDAADWQPATCIGDPAPDPQFVAHRQYRRPIPDRDLSGQCSLCQRDHQYADEKCRLIECPLRDQTRQRP